MRQRHHARHRDEVARALDDLDRLDAGYAEVVAALDRQAALRQAVAEVPAFVGVDAAMVGEQQGADIVLRQLSGTRTEALAGLHVSRGHGMGGRVIVEQAVRWVPDYLTSTAITHHYDSPVIIEQIRGLIAAPIAMGGRQLGVLYGATRRETDFGTRAADAMAAAARRTGTALLVAERARHAAEVAVHEERRRLALDLHDSVGAMLFAIGAGVRTVVDEFDLAPDLRLRLNAIERRAEEAAATLRESLRALSVSPQELRLCVALRADCRSFEERTGITARLVTVDELPVLDTTRAKALVGVAREALLNVEKHARARTVVVSVFPARGGVTLAVADDGVGVAGDGPPPGSPRMQCQGLGVEASGERLSRLGGYLTLARNDDGGCTLKAWVPC